MPGSDRSIKKAYQQAAQGNVDDAVTMLRRASRISDPHGKRAEALGMILYQAGRWAAAAGALALVSRFRPSDMQCLFYLASATSRSGNWDEALRLLGDAAKENPTDVAPFAAKCLILLERPDFPTAISAYQQARERFDANPAQDSYSMGLLEQCSESIAQVPQSPGK